MSRVVPPRSALLLLAVFSTSLPAYAQQQTRVTVSAGYQDMVYTIAQNEEPLPPGFEWVCLDQRGRCQFVSGSYSILGLYADVAAHITPRIAVVGEWQWNGTNNPGLLGGDPDDVLPGFNLSVQQFVAGLRVLRPHPRFAPFAQVLIGAARVAGSAAGISESIAAADLRAGVGIDLMFTRHVGLRGSGSYTHLFTDQVRRNNLAQFGLGVVIKM